MSSDIYIKTGSSTFSKATNIFIKTTSSLWSAAKNVWMFLDAGWTRVWPLSGVFSLTSPYIASSSGSTTPISSTSAPRRVGNSVWGKNGTWNPNGWIINSYQYRWRTYSSATEINDLNRTSQTALATYSGPVELVIPASYDRGYLSFFIQANSSGGSAYNGFAESGTEYGGVYVIRQQPINLTGVLSTYVPRVGIEITYSSTWQTGDAYAEESNRTTINWYRNSSNSTIGGTFRGSGPSFTPTSADLNSYIYVVETRFNSGTDYDLGTNVGVEKKVITTMPVGESLNGATSTSIVSVSRLTDTTTRTIVSSTGASGPYYQMFWYSLSTAPSPETRYDAASTTSTVTEDFSFTNNQTVYFYIRSSTDNLGNTTQNGIGTSGTYGEYGPATGAASYTYLAPSGGSASTTNSGGTAISTGLPGDTIYLSLTNPSASPAASSQTIRWRVNDGGTGGNTFQGGSVLQTGGTSFVLPSSLYGGLTSAVGYSVRPEVSFNNGVGDLQLNGNSVLILDPAPGAFSYSISNSTVTPTQPSAYTNFFNTNGTEINYDWNDTANTSYWVSSISGGAEGSRSNNRFVSNDFWPTTPGNTYTTSVYSVNTNRQATVSWGASTNANSYVVSFSGATQTSPITVTGTSLTLTASGSSGSTVTVNSVTAYANGNGTGASRAGTLSGLSGVTIFDSNSGTRSSGPSTAPQVLPPVNTVLPSISPSSGTAGSTTYSCTTGSWNNNPTGYSYQWQYRESAQIWPAAPGTSTNSTYLPPSNFASIYGNNLRCRVTASNAGGSTEAFASSVTVNSPVTIPSNGTVSLSGGNTVGSTITASTSGWLNTPTSYDVFITTALNPNTPTAFDTRVASSGGGSSVSYTIPSAAGITPVNRYRAFATASNSAGTSSIVQSTTVITTQASATTPSTPGTPTLTYVPANNTSTTWGYSASWGASSGSGTIQYQIDCQGISGGTGTRGLYTSTSATFNLSRNDNTWRIRVRATNDGGSTWSSYSGYSAYA